MNYHKLLFFGLIMASLASQSTFGMQKQSQSSDFKNQVSSWISEHKTGLFVGSCALLAGYGLYKYFTKPEAPEKIKTKINTKLAQKAAKIYNDAKNDSPYLQVRAGIITEEAGRSGYKAAYSIVKNQFGQLIGVDIVCQYACDKNKAQLSYNGQSKTLTITGQESVPLIQG